MPETAAGRPIAPHTEDACKTHHGPPWPCWGAEARALGRAEALDPARLARALIAATFVSWPKSWDRSDFEWVARQVAAKYREEPHA